MKRIFTAILILISSLSFAQVSVGWFNYPGGVGIATDALNNVYTANWDYNAGGDITLTKRDAAGNILWEVPYNNTDFTRHEVATWVATDNAGNILVSGTIRSGYSNPVNAASILMKYNPSGTLLWRVVYESSFDGSSTRKCLVDANNNIYVLGIGTGPNGQVTKVKKFNSSGVTVWNYFDSGIGAPITFKFTPDNKIVIVHRSITGSINGFSKIDLNGNNIWSYAGVNSLSIGDAAGDSFGNTYIINGEYVVSNAGSILTKLSPTGAVIWSKTNTINGNKVEVGTDNNPVVGGYPGAGYGVVIMKYDANGNLLWQNLDADGPALALLALAPMRLDASNAAYIAGSTMSSMGLCKVNSDGTSAWAATTSSGYPVWFEFGTDNSIYIVGGTTARFTQSGTIPSPPAAPSNLVATASGTSVINLTWIDNASNETSYVLQRSLSSASGFAAIATLGSNSTSYSNTGLNSSTTYYYRVQAVNTAGVSAWSNTANATTGTLPPPTIPAAPTNLTAVAAGCNQINLMWTDNSNNETAFEISRATSLNGTYVIVATLAANTTAYTNTGLKRNRTYYFRVRSLNTIGSSAWSNKANAVASCNAGLKVVNGQVAVSLYPNPATDVLYLQGITAIKEIMLVEVYDMTGRKMFANNMTGNSINISVLKAGTYTLRVLQNNTTVYAGKFIKN